jgi:hypothetical protein
MAEAELTYLKYCGNEIMIEKSIRLNGNKKTFNHRGLITAYPNMLSENPYGYESIR